MHDQGGFLKNSIGKELVTTRLAYIQITIVEQSKCSIVLAGFIKGWEVYNLYINSGTSKKTDLIML